jgi:hypothetical protein
MPDFTKKLAIRPLTTGSRSSRSHQEAAEAYPLHRAPRLPLDCDHVDHADNLLARRH